MSFSTADQPATLSPWRIFLAFLMLGVTAFGGPVAHIGYFRTEFVERRKWIDADQFQDLIALCQFLPGPMSSQVGFAIGMLRGRIPGGLAAWLGFTMPSAILMIGLGVGTNLFESGLPAALVHGLKLAAVAIVAWALWQMARNSCTDAVRIGFAAAACAIMLFTNIVWVQVGVIAAAAVAGRLLIKPVAAAVSASDGVPFVGDFSHPRSAGTFARVLGHYVRDVEALSLMSALQKMTLDPARRLMGQAPAMRRKGRVQQGMDADHGVRPGSDSRPGNLFGARAHFPWYHPRAREWHLCRSRWGTGGRRLPRRSHRLGIRGLMTHPPPPSFSAVAEFLRRAPRRSTVLMRALESIIPQSSSYGTYRCQSGRVGVDCAIV